MTAEEIRTRQAKLRALNARWVALSQAHRTALMNSIPGERVELTGLERRVAGSEDVGVAPNVRVAMELNAFCIMPVHLELVGHPGAVPVWTALFT